MKALTIAQARAHLAELGIHVSVTGMYQLVKQGRLPHVKLNRLYITDLDGFLARCAVESTQPAPRVELEATRPSPRKVAPQQTLQLPKKRRFGAPDPAHRRRD